MNIEELLASVRRDFLAHLPSREKAIIDAVEAGDLDGAKRCCHKLRGTAGSFGEFAVGEAAGALEDAIDLQLGGGSDDLTPLVARLRAEVASALA